MCFSAPASFSIGIVLLGVGALSIAAGLALPVSAQTAPAPSSASRTLGFVVTTWNTAILES